MSERDFGELLTKGIRYICARESKPMQIVQDELGYAVGRSGSSVIRYWRQGHWPSKPSDVETLARAIVQRGHVDRAWLEQFLRSANFPDAAGLSDELFPSHNHHQYLPLPPTELIGRKRETTNLIEQLQNGHVRLLTLAGPPGVGKTRLALHLAAALRSTFEDGAVFVSLVSTRDPELVISVIAAAIGLIDDDGQSLKARLIRSLRDRELLLVLDNFEHVIAAARYMAELLSEAPHLKVLVTSREPLHIYGEYEYVVHPLELPVMGEPIRLEVFSRIPSIQLFVERATAANPDFRIDLENAEAVAAICIRLDGLPLAIELAASRSKWQTPHRLLTQFNDRFRLLVNGPLDWPARQQTLQATIDWSYALLNDAEQRLFRWLSVFQGGCTIEAVEKVCSSSDVSANQMAEVSLLSLLESLQDKNLLQSVPSPSMQDTSRYSMLETIHEYASYKLNESGEATVAAQRHLDWCLQLAEQGNQNLRGSDQLLWLNRLDHEIKNVRKALLWCVEHPVDVESGLRIAADLHWFWRLRSRLSEGRDWLDKLLAIDLQADAPRSVRQAQAQAMRVASSLHGLQGDPTKALELALSGLNLFEEIGDQSGAVSSKAHLSILILLSGNVHKSVSLAEEALVMCQTNGDHFTEAELLDGPLSTAALMQDDYARAIALHEQALALRRALHDTDGEAWSLFMLAGSVYAFGDTLRSQTLYVECCALWREVGNWRWYADALDELGRVICKRGDYSQAKALFEESLITAQNMYDPYRMARAMCDLAKVACTVEDYTQAQALLKQIAVRVGELVNTPLPAMFLISAAQLNCLTGLAEHAARLVGAAQAALRNTNPYLGTSDRFEYEAVLSVIRLALSEETFDRACSEGRAMSLDAALAYATDEVLS